MPDEAVAVLARPFAKRVISAGPVDDSSLSGDDRRAFCVRELRAGRVGVYFDYAHGTRRFLVENCADLVANPAVSIPATVVWAFALRRADYALAANMSRAMSYLSTYSEDMLDLLRRHFGVGNACDQSGLDSDTPRVALSAMGGVFITSGSLFVCALLMGVASKCVVDRASQRALADSSVSCTCEAAHHPSTAAAQTAARTAPKSQAAKQRLDSDRSCVSEHDQDTRV